MSVFGAGLRPWKRQTETKRAADSSVPGKGELVVSDTGKVYAGDGATQAKNLSPMLRKTDADATYANAFPASQVIAIDPATGNVTSVTTNGVATNYIYNSDGSVATDSCNGITRDYGYDGSGNLTTITARL